jgi:hypothetical protein
MNEQSQDVIGWVFTILFGFIILFGICLFYFGGRDRPQDEQNKKAR